MHNSAGDFFTLKHGARARGRQASDNGLGVIIAQIRKYLSTAFVRAQGLCLIKRLCFLGKGSKEAVGRRELDRRLEIPRKRDLHAHYQEHIYGSRLVHTCQIFSLDCIFPISDMILICDIRKFFYLHLLSFFGPICFVIMF